MKTMEDFDDFYKVYKNNICLLIPKQERMLKIMYDDYPCPIAHKFSMNIRCEHSKMKYEEDAMVIYCECKDTRECKLSFKKEGV